MKAKKRVRKILQVTISAIIVFIYFIVLSMMGQHYRQTLRSTNLQHNTFSFTSGWKFHVGDDPAWATSSVNDSVWNSVVSDSLPDSYHGEIAWFRLHLNQDSFPRNKELMMELEHYGASEIYLDGIKIASFGTVSNKKKNEIAFNPRLFPTNFYFQKNVPHVIAVRYSNVHYFDQGDLLYNYNSGFKLSLTERNFLLTREVSYRYQQLLNFFLGAFLLTLAFVHLLLYIFYRKSREHLFFSVFATCYSIIFFMLAVANTTSSPATEIMAMKVFLFFLNPCLFISLMFFIFYIYERKFPSAVWIAVAVGSIGILYVTTHLVSSGTYFTSLIWYGVFSVIVMSRGTFRIIKEKQPGAKILAAGVAVFAALIFVAVSIVIFSGRLGTNMITGNMVYATIFQIAEMSIPISMSVYLAYTSSQTNKNLQLQLIEVENLSAKTIEQEREKQKILESQKENLEREVTERTAEIVKQKNIIEEKNKDITASIQYAKRIQQSLFPTEKYIERIMKRLRGK